VEIVLKNAKEEACSESGLFKRDEAAVQLINSSV
jgi:hypothetical protein